MTKLAKITKKQKKPDRLGPISPKELKFWLEGILEFQPVGWVPSKDQWENIKEKIFSLSDEENNTNFHVPRMSLNTYPEHPKDRVHAPSYSIPQIPISQSEEGGSSSMNETNFREPPIRPLSPEQERAQIERAKQGFG